MSLKSQPWSSFHKLINQSSMPNNDRGCSWFDFNITITRQKKNTYFDQLLPLPKMTSGMINLCFIRFKGYACLFIYKTFTQWYSHLITLDWITSRYESSSLTLQKKVWCKNASYVSVMNRFCLLIFNWIRFHVKWVISSTCFYICYVSMMQHLPKNLPEII